MKWVGFGLLGVAAVIAAAALYARFTAESELPEWYRITRGFLSTGAETLSAALAAFGGSPTLASPRSVGGTIFTGGAMTGALAGAAGR